MFIPTTPKELNALSWSQLDVILVSGDTYIDSPYNGIALIGKQLLAAGYRVGIIAQPGIHSSEDITRLGEPKLFWGISAGAVDSMVANTTALGKPRRTDDHTPGGLNTKRPDRACIVYSNLIRQYFKGTVPIVLGGVEASLRRVAHYDYWSDSLRRSILLDAKANYLLYGMADLSILELARALRDGTDPTTLRGLVYASPVMPEGYLELPSFEAVQVDKAVFTSMFHQFYQNNDPISARGLAQRYGDRFVIQNPPAATLTTEQMDAVYGLEFEHAAHPYYAAMGEVRALETIRHAIPTHRGCYGECNFCAIAVHEGRRVTWRSKQSIVAEARKMGERPDFRGIISDLSGPTANMYGFECRVKGLRGACQDKSCIYPEVCPLLGITHQPLTELLKALRQVEGVRKVFIGSGIRHDLVMADANYGEAYLAELVGHHVSGQLKLAPEHSQSAVLKRMRKPGTTSLLAFKRRFEAINESLGKEQYLTYYMIAAYPGCTDTDMIALQQFAGEKLGVLPEQVQIFTPTPSTYASLMYYTEQDPFTGEALFVEKGLTGKMKQKAIITGWRTNKGTTSTDAGRTPMSKHYDSDRDRHSRKPTGQGYPHQSDSSSRFPRQDTEGAQTSSQDAKPREDRERAGRPGYPQDRPNYQAGGRIGRESGAAGGGFSQRSNERELDTSYPDRRKKPCQSADHESAEVRVIRDDYGDNFNNQPPKTWQEHKQNSEERPTSRRQEGRGTGADYPRKSGSSYRERSGRTPGQSQGERPLGSYRGDKPAGERSYRQRPGWSDKDKVRGSDEPGKPAGERSYHQQSNWSDRNKTQGSAESGKPAGSYRGNRPAGERPYRKQSNWPGEDQSKGSDRPERPAGERPYQGRSTWSGKGKPKENRSGAKPYRERSEHKNSGYPSGHKPAGGAQRSGNWKDHPKSGSPSSGSYSHDRPGDHEPVKKAGGDYRARTTTRKPREDANES
ncbi:MAG: YgiQ family radical SAM protein [Anaerolineaceae bacterium]